jgi:hypothetical protein
LVIGIPAALVFGSVVWRRVSDDMGIVPAVDIPWPLLGAVALSFIVVAIAVATTVDSRRRHANLATLLRVE